MRLATIAFAAALALGGAVGMPQSAEAGKRGHFAFSVPGFSLYIDKRHHGRHYHRRHYKKHRYYGRHYKPHYWRYKHRRHKRHHRHRRGRRW